MIVVSAHNVVSSQYGEGVNVYYYRKDGELPHQGNGTVDVMLAQSKPGELIHLKAAIKPGGNRVSALLDFVAPDQLDFPAVQGFFDEVRNKLQRSRPPLVYANRDYGLHFNSDIGLYPQRKSLFDDLSQSILRFVEHPPAKSLRDQTPLVVLVRVVPDDEGGLSFELEQASAQKIIQLKGPKWKSARVRAQMDTFQDFMTADSEWLGQMSKVLTQLDEHEILKLGGIRFVRDEPEQRLLWQWPSAKKRTT